MEGQQGFFLPIMEKKPQGHPHVVLAQKGHKDDPKYKASPELAAAVSEAIEQYPIPESIKYTYGTAGFRMKANAGLDHVVFTVGLIACLRSKSRNSSVIGIMITASHNPPDDNGVKIVDPMGEMLESEWEQYATDLANTACDRVVDKYTELLNELLLDGLRELHNVQPRIVFARDSRASGPHLVKALKASLDALRVDYHDYGILTTPQLHYMVRCLNTLTTPYYYGEPSEKGYFKKMADAWVKVMHGRTNYGHLTVDCANGVGGPKLQEFIKYLPKTGQGAIDIRVVNDNITKPESLNFECGADYVKTRQRAPPSSKAAPMDRCCSLDGDADRIVYYFIDEHQKFQLLDGDRIATLAAVFIGEMVQNAGLSEKLKIGVVQTAYANGASTEFLDVVLKLPSVCTSTGVKHLHNAAHRFDIGIYFEANGHGTVLFSDLAVEIIKEAKPQSPAQEHALESLVALTDLVNQAVGDAISDLLLTEVSLSHKCWDPQQWKNTYFDLPNRLERVEVEDRSLFVTEDADRKLVSPPGAQDYINKQQRLYVKGRSFARASGTEDAVRVYAEAHSQAEAERLAHAVAGMVRDRGRRHSYTA